MERVLALAAQGNTTAKFLLEWAQMNLKRLGQVRLDFHRQSMSRHRGGSVRLIETLPAVLQTELDAARQNLGKPPVPMQSLHNLGVESMTLQDIRVVQSLQEAPGRSCPELSASVGTRD